MELSELSEADLKYLVERVASKVPIGMVHEVPELWEQLTWGGIEPSEVKLESINQIPKDSRPYAMFMSALCMPYNEIPLWIGKIIEFQKEILAYRMEKGS